MAIKQKTAVIKGEEFLLTSIPALAGVRILKELMKLGGPAFAAFQAKSDDQGASAEGLALAIEALLENLDKSPVEQLAVDLISSATKGNMAINFNLEFSGEYDKLFLLLKEIVEFNFGSVFTLFGSDAKA